MDKSGFIMKISGISIRANRPEPIISDIDVVPYKQKIDPQIAVEDLLAGYYVLIVDFYSSGLMILRELKKHLKYTYSDTSFKGQRSFRSAYQKLSNRLLLEVRNDKLAVRKSPAIGWLKILYPEIDEFLLSFPQIQGLNSSWQWYEKGILIPVLNRKIHPWFGTYFPTRYEHLELFDNWLKQYKGKKKSAIDIGIGSGILSFLMLKHGFKKVCGTDLNPNSIIGINEDLKQNKIYSKVDLIHGDLFGDSNLKTGLIVFNPPWLPAEYKSEGLDKSIYYDDDLFLRFFTEAKKHLKTDGRVVLLFSNLAQITNVADIHPIKTELSYGGRFQKELFIQKKVRIASKKTRRNPNQRSSEMVELWVLKPIDNL